MTPLEHKLLEALQPFATAWENSQASSATSIGRPDPAAYTSNRLFEIAARVYAEAMKQKEKDG